MIVRPHAKLRMDALVCVIEHDILNALGETLLSPLLEPVGFLLT